MRGSLPGNDVELLDGIETDSNESALLYDRKHTCPICSRQFTAKTVLSSKVFSRGSDLDLRPKDGNVDTIKYNVVECPVCGYADLISSFDNVLPKERDELKEKSIKWDIEANLSEVERDYHQAYTYYKTAMRCDLIRGAKKGKRAYTAMYTAWLLRGWREAMEKAEIEVKPTDAMGIQEEMKILKYARANFKDAEVSEEFPINGISEPTFDYLMAAISYMVDEREDATKYVLRALRNKELKPNLRIKAEDLKDLITKKK